MIRLNNVNKTYESSKAVRCHALKNVSLEIPRGDFVAIVGPSGCGKTTLLNIIGCLDEHDEGEYLLEGVDVGQLNEGKKAKLRNKKIGFVLQDFALINNQTVAYNVELPLLFGNTPYSKIQPKVSEALKKVGLGDKVKNKANELSGGQRQRVAIARALINSPSLILADEPTGQLDSKMGMQIMELLTALNKEGITVVVVTHDHTVASYAKRIITMSDGEIISVKQNK